MTTARIYQGQIKDGRWFSRLSLVIVASIMGVAVALWPWPAVVVVCTAFALLWLSRLQPDTLIGIWLVGGLFDPAFPTFHGFSPSNAIFLIAIAKYLSQPRPRKLPYQVTLILAIVWLAEWCALAFGSADPASSLRYLVTLASLSAVVLVGVTAGSWRTWTSWMVRASGVAAGLALFQYLLFELTGVLAFPQPANLFFIETGLSNVFRSTGLGTDPNFLALWILPGAGVAAVALLDRVASARWLAYLGLCIAGIWTTQSRGALVALFIGLVILILIRLSGYGLPAFKRIGLGMALLGASVFALPAFLHLAEKESARDPATVQVRLDQIPAVLHDAVSGNWFGMGHGAELEHTAAVSSLYIGSGNVIHNTLLEALFEIGWIGALGMALLVGTGLYWSIRTLYRSSASSQVGKPSLMMLSGAFFFLVLGLQNLGGYFFRPLWFCWAALAGVVIGGVVKKDAVRVVNEPHASSENQ